ncbi:MAG TPA: ABC transporter permease [Micropepsaceae bacterium]|nr:ABC transporter permease [Micropepsaceae bacterium]HRK70026.1 ABC transporter permease [Micropepsaceae bacterium]
MYWTIIQLSLRELRANKMRTILTALGIIIGVMAVIILVTLGNGFTAQITKEFEGIGQNLIFVSPDSNNGPNRARVVPFDMRDVDAIRRGVPGIEFVAPSNGSGGRVVYGNVNHDTVVIGSTNEYFKVRLWVFEMGREFTEGELAAGKPVCIIGKTVRDTLFGAQNPLGLKIRVENVSCEVIGLLAPKGQTTFGNDEDDRILMPLRTYQRRIVGNSDVATIQVAVANGQDAQAVIDGLRSLLRQRRSVPEGEPDNFSIDQVSAFLGEVQNVLGIMTMFVGAIAFVSLIVGGIGIMNIMLVSVTERTREIGIRLAIGAQQKDVLWQFLIEAMILGLLGGIAGIVIGLGLSVLITGLMGVPFIPSIGIIVFAAVFSALFGIVFGFFPALRASRLNPIEALRYE